MNKKIILCGKNTLRYLAKKVAARDANTTCTFMYYQPEIPKAVKDCKKVRKSNQKE
ncbi:MAG: cyclic lactone autoinducer peptide [Blautia sp.]|uniref:cyclic lactone autoinducer peptide n=1 Tax=Blautia sp. TaxID=1955243 RepID=UPI0015A6218F